MPRELIEFYCNDCDGYFRVNLNLAISGTFQFKCPQCDRMHPRKVFKGEMISTLEERSYHSGEGKRIERNMQEGVGEVISVPKSAYSKESMFDKVPEEVKKRGGFLVNRWIEKAKNTLLGV